MPVFTVEVVEVVVYRGQIEAATEEDASRAAVEDLLANAGSGCMVFAEVADRTSAVVNE